MKKFMVIEIWNGSEYPLDRGLDRRTAKEQAAQYAREAEILERTTTYHLEEEAN